MNIFLNILLAVQILSALAMIGLILVQHGKGADLRPVTSGSVLEGAAVTAPVPAASAAVAPATPASGAAQIPSK